MENETGISPKEGGVSVRVVGVGRAGCRIVDRLASQLPGTDRFRALDCDEHDLRDLGHAGVEQFGRNLLRGLGTGGDPEMGRAAAEANRSRWEEIIEGSFLTILVGGLGGGTASGALPVMAKQAREKGTLVLTLVSLPLDFQGEHKRVLADAGLNQLRAASDAVLPISTQALDRTGERPVGDLFREIDQRLVQGIDGILHMMERDSAIPIDFRKLCNALRGRNSRGAFALAEAEGEDRVSRAVDALLESPMLGGDLCLKDSSSLLLHVRGGRDLCRSEVEQIVRHLQDRTGRVDVEVGASFDAGREGILKLTLIASWQRTEPGEVVMTDEIPGDDVAFSLTIRNLVVQENLPGCQTEVARTNSRYVPPPPSSTERHSHQLLSQTHGSRARRKVGRKLEQGQLKREPVSRGRFDKSAPSLYDGQDLDVPTFVRRGLPHN